MLVTCATLTPASHTPAAIWLTTLLFAAISPLTSNASRRTVVIRTRSGSTAWSFASTTRYNSAWAGIRHLLAVRACHPNCPEIDGLPAFPFTRHLGT